MDGDGSTWPGKCLPSPSPRCSTEIPFSLKRPPGGSANSMWEKTPLCLPELGLVQLVWPLSIVFFLSGAHHSVCWLCEYVGKWRDLTTNKQYRSAGEYWSTTVIQKLGEAVEIASEFAYSGVPASRVTSSYTMYSPRGGPNR